MSGMFTMPEYKQEGVNFWAGKYPVATDVLFTVENAAIPKGSLVVETEDGVRAMKGSSGEGETKVQGDNAAAIIGVATADSEGDTVSVAYTGEILLSAIIIPEGADVYEIKKALRKLCIFLR